MPASPDRKLDEPANRRYVEKDAAALREELAGWQLEKPDRDKPSTLNSPHLRDDTIDLMVGAYREMIEGFDDANVKWGDYRRDTLKRKVRQAVPGLKLEKALADCGQVREYAQEMADRENLTPDREREMRIGIAHNLMGSIVIRAILTAEAIGIKPANVEKGFF